MDALTSFELEAQRRRETVASDRDQAWARALSVEMAGSDEIVRQATPAPLSSDRSECEPTSLARQPVG